MKHQLRLAITYIIVLTKMASCQSASLLHSLADHSCNNRFSHPCISTDHHHSVLRASVIQPFLNSVEDPLTGASLKSFHVILNVSLEFGLGKVLKHFIIPVLAPFFFNTIHLSI